MEPGIEEAVGQKVNCPLWQDASESDEEQIFEVFTCRTLSCWYPGKRLVFGSHCIPVDEGSDRNAVHNSRACQDGLSAKNQL